MHPKKKSVTYSKIAGDAIVDLAKMDKKVVGITAAMPSGTGLTTLMKDHPDQYFDVGIAEGHAVTFAGGMATEGFKPIVAIYSTFLQRAFDNILHDICIQNLPVIFAMDRAGLVGADGPTHHGVFDITYLRSLPNMTVMIPRDENELRQMFYTAYTLDSPSAIRYPRGNAEGVELHAEFYPLEIGKGEVLMESPNPDVAILSVGTCVYPSVDAARRLAEEGISAIVADMKFVKPIDAELLKSIVSQTKQVVTVEENSAQGGFGSAVAEWFIENNIFDVKQKILGIGDHFVDHGTQSELRAREGIDADGIFNATRLFVKDQRAQGAQVEKTIMPIKDYIPTSKSP